jgi:hypothetical protein
MVRVSVRVRQAKGEIAHYLGMCNWRGRITQEGLGKFGLNFHS